MSLYDDCIKLNKGIITPGSLKESSMPLSVSDIELACNSTIPSIFSKADFVFPDFIDVFYISDLHLDVHIKETFPSGATDEQINDFIEKITKSLFTGEFGDQVKDFRSPVVLFGGDIAASFSLADKFYHSFIEEWKHIVETLFKEVIEALYSIEDELADLNERIEAWKNNHPWTERAQKPLTEYKSVPDEIKNCYIRSNELRAQIKRHENGLSYRWRDRYREGLFWRYVYTIIGNHEFWDFESYEACTTAYEKLFSDIGVKFLNSSICDFGLQKYPRRWMHGKLSLFGRNEDPDLYDIQLLKASNMVIVGGTGYAAEDSEFNAKNMIYNIAISPEKEKDLTKKWVEVYRQAIEIAKEKHSPLIVLSHMPVSDWLGQNEDLSNVIFFSGHTHDNIAYHDDERNSFLFADNQIGYKGKRFSFKKARIYRAKNPFASMLDGYREININEYKEFSWFINEKTSNTGTIERYLNHFHGKLFVIKQQGCYGFFITSCMIITETK